MKREKISQAFINERFAAFTNYLLRSGRVKNKTDLAKALHISSQRLGDLMALRPGKNVTSEILVNTLLAYSDLELSPQESKFFKQAIYLDGGVNAITQIEKLQLERDMYKKEVEALQQQIDFINRGSK